MKESRKKQLMILSTILPLGTQGGSCSRLSQMIKHYADHFDVHLVSVTNVNYDKIDDQIIRLYAKSQHFFNWDRPTYWEKIILRFQNVFFCRAFFFQKSFLSYFSKFVKKNYQPDVILVQKCMMGALFVESGLREYFKDVPAVLDEGVLHYISYEREMQSTANPIKKIKYYLRYKRLSNYCRKLIKSFERLTVVTKEEENILHQFCPKEKSMIITHGIDVFDDHEQISIDQQDCAIFGPFHYKPNRQGLDWFMKYVYSEINKIGFNQKIYIVGSNPPQTE